jgi:hypothetical protein
VRHFHVALDGAAIVCVFGCCVTAFDGFTLSERSLPLRLQPRIVQWLVLGVVIFVMYIRQPLSALIKLRFASTLSRFLLCRFIWNRLTTFLSFRYLLEIRGLVDHTFLSRCPLIGRCCAVYRLSFFRYCALDAVHRWFIIYKLIWSLILDLKLRLCWGGWINYEYVVLVTLLVSYLDLWQGLVLTLARFWWVPILRVQCRLFALIFCIR